MTELTENLSLFAEDQIPRKAPRRTAAKTTRASTKAAATEPEAAAPSTVKAPRARKTTTKAEATPEADAPVATAKPRATRTTKAKVETKVEEEAAPVKKATRARTTKAAPTKEEEAPAVPAPAKKVTRRTTKAASTEEAAPAPVEAAAPEAPAKPKSRTPRATTARSAKSAKVEAPTAAQSIPNVETAVTTTTTVATTAPLAAVPSVVNITTPVTVTPSSHDEWRPGGSTAVTTTTSLSTTSTPPPARREGHEPRREHRDRENGRDFRNRNRRNRDRDRDRGNRQERHGGDFRESRESREQRIAAARQEFARNDYPAQDGPSAPAVDDGPRPDPVFAEGIVEVSGKGFGFLRDPKRGFAQHPGDVFVTPEVCRKYNLRDGMWIRGEIRRGNRGPQLFRLVSIEGEEQEEAKIYPLFEELTTINPNHWLKLETTPERYTTRVIDLMAPIGRGQRGLIVAPPRTGKTTLLQHIAEAVGVNHPDMKLIILLVDERPEEVTEIRRTVPHAEIMASSNDQEIKSHTRIAQLAIERARRLVEMGKHVFILLDSITRVGRAFNNATSGGGRTMSGGVDARALEIPRKLFAAARNTEEAGSLTIIATALIETGSRMDDLIFQEFKGTGNMELVLDRKISDLRVYPAVDIFQSGTRREELLLPETNLHKINIIRRGLAGHKPVEAIERLLSFLKRFPTNAQMLREIPG